MILVAALVDVAIVVILGLGRRLVADMSAQCGICDDACGFPISLLLSFFQWPCLIRRRPLKSPELICYPPLH